MPTFRFHGTDPEKLLQINKTLHQELSTLYNLPTDHITIEVIHSFFFSLDATTDSYPLIEVIAFKRESVIEDQVAQCVYRHLQSVGYPESELYFSYVEPRSYYCNGKHC
ncbi:MAG: DUF1904 family protein [Bacteroidales bacterium]